MKNLKEYHLGKGMNLYCIPTEKFKTSTVSIYIHRQLNRGDVTKNALLPNVLKRGCIPFPTSQSMAQHLEELYGTIFEAGVVKKGEDQILCFNFETIHNAFTPGNEPLLEEVLKVAKYVVFEPITEYNAFKKEFVVQEKENLKNEIEGLINNKMSYAVQRCFEEMCKNENFGLYELGNSSDLDKINEINLFEYYKRVITTSPIDIFVSGNFVESEIYELVKTLFLIDNGASESAQADISYPKTDIIKQVTQQKKIEEPLEVAQGKLSLGFRTKVSPRDQEYYALMVYNAILGGGPHSKLFNNVREKLSLAYYVFSRLERFKGLMLVSSGIEVQNFQKAYDEIMLQVEDMKNGNISEIEYQAAVKSLINSIKSLTDNAFQMEDYYLGQLVGGTDDSMEDLMSKITSVTKEDVVKAARNIALDTVYFLKNKE